MISRAASMGTPWLRGVWLFVLRRSREPLDTLPAAELGDDATDEASWPAGMVRS